MVSELGIPSAVSQSHQLYPIVDLIDLLNILTSWIFATWNRMGEQLQLPANTYVVVQVFEKGHPPRWFVNRQAAAARYVNALTRTATNRLYTTHLGVDAFKGAFFMFE